MPWYSPELQLTEDNRKIGLKYLYYDGMSAHAMTLLVTGAFLPGMALALGANNFVIGILASLGPVSQMLQIPAILLVEKVALRKLLTVFFAGFSRVMLLAVAAIPFLGHGSLSVAFFLIFMLIFFGTGSIAGCAWNSWVKDVIPEETRGRYLAGRMSAATAIGAVLTVFAGFGIDGLTNLLGSDANAYAVIFSVAAVVGLVGVYCLTRVPEPKMSERPADSKWLQALFEPLKDQNFRRLLAFTASWNFTIILAGAFFAVYMLRRIGLSMGTVILLAVISQVTNIYFFRIWGAIADRFSNKSVLAVASPLFLIVILLYPFTTMPDRHAFSIPILVAIHVLGGISTAGFTLCAGNIAMRLAPKGKATAYLGANAFCGGIAATVAPIIGGILGTFFATKEITIRIFYRANIHLDESMSIPALNFQGIDFVFFTAVIAGLFAMHRLSKVEEEGTVSETVVRDQVYASVRQTFVSASNIAGVRRITYFPYEMLRQGSKKTGAAARKAASSIRKLGSSGHASPQ